MCPRLALAVLLSLLVALPSAAQTSAEEQYRFLAGLVDKGMHELAVGEAQKFLRAYPEHARAPLARYRLAGALWALDRQTEAAHEYETLARDERFEYRAECLFRVGDAARARGDERAAAAAYEAVVKAGQAYLVPPALFALGECAFRAGAYERAEPHYGEILRAHPESAEAPLARRTLVWCALQRGDLAETARRARAFLEVERDPARADELRVLLAEALTESDPKAALAALRAIQGDEQLEARLRGEGFALATLGDHAGAAGAFEALLERAPEGRYACEARLQAGVERLRAGDPEAAKVRLREAAQSGDGEAALWLAQAQREAGDPKAALSTLEGALRARPSAELATRLALQRAECLTALGRTAEAVAAYETSGSESALHAAAVTALNAGRTDEAVRLAQRGLEQATSEERRASARGVLAEAHFAAQHWSEAEPLFSAALDAAEGAAGDEHDAAHCASRLAWCRYLAGDRAAARERFNALAERYPRSDEAEEARALLVRIAEEAGEREALVPLAKAYLARHSDGRFADEVALRAAHALEGAAQRKGLAAWLVRFPESPRRARVLLELAELESAAGAHADAHKHYEELLAQNSAGPERARATYGLAFAAFEARDFASAREQVLRLTDEHSGAEAGLRAAALELDVWIEAGDGQLDAALAAWRELARLGDEARTLAGARACLAALRSAQRLEDAEALLAEARRSLRTPAVTAELELEGAALALERKDTRKAESALARAKQAGADSGRVAEAAYRMGEALLADGQTEQAERWLTDAAAAGPRAREARFALGFAALKRADWSAAEAHFERFLGEAPQHASAAEARFLLGECAYRRGDFETAARRLAEARASTSGELAAKCLFRLGLALGELQRFPECERVLAELAQVAPQFPNLAEAERMRGHALASQKKYRAARAAFERTLALDSGDLAAAARLGIACTFEAEGALDAALSDYLKVALLFAHEPSVAEALLGAGRVLEAQGQTPQAAERYAELVREHPQTSFAEEARKRLAALGAPSAKVSDEPRRKPRAGGG